MRKKYDDDDSPCFSALRFDLLESYQGIPVRKKKKKNRK